MNLNLQKVTLTKMMDKDGTEDRGFDPGACLDEVDPELTLSENIAHFYDRGFLKNQEVDVDAQFDLEMRQEQESLKNNLIISFEPVYLCYECAHSNKEVFFRDRAELVKHYVNDHDLRMLEFIPKYPYDFDYIILSALVERYFTELKHHPRHKYFKISSEELHKKLLNKLGFEKGEKDAPSNQTPSHALKRLGLLEKKSKEKNRLGWNSKGNRVYHINIVDLEKAVMESEFDDLKLKLGQVDFDDFYVRVEPSSSSSGKNEDVDSSTGGSGGTDYDISDLKPKDGLDDEWDI